MSRAVRSCSGMSPVVSRSSSISSSRGSNAALMLAVGAAMSLAVADAALARTDFDWATATSGSWSMTTRWSPNGTPNGAADTATIDATGADYTVTLDLNPTLDFFTLNSANATLFASSRTFTVNSGANLLAGVIQWRDSAWNGAALTNAAAGLIFEGGSAAINTAFTNNGDVTVRGIPGLHASLALASGAVNNGTWTQTSTSAANANITVGGAGAFLNGATGTFNINAGAGGARTYSWNLTNDGAFNNDADTTFSRTGAVHTNNGQFNILTGRTLTVQGASQAFVQAAGLLDIQGSGLLHINGATYTSTGGTVQGNILVSDGTANLMGGSGGLLIMRGGLNILNGSIGPTQSVLVRGESGINSAVNTEDGFANYGTLTFSSVAVAASANLTAQGAGAFINGPTGIININAGTGGARTYSWNLTNDGTINVNAAATFQRTSAVMTTSGTFNVSAGNSLLVNASNQRFDLAGGSLSVDPAGLFHVNSARFRHVGGTLNGSVLVSDGTLDLLHDGVGSYIMRGGSNILNGDIGSAQSVLIRGEPGINSAVSTEDGFANYGTLTFSSVAVAASANLTAQGAGAFINGPTGIININAGTGGARTYSWNLTNDGTINVNAAATFQRTSAVMTTSGTFNVSAGNSLLVNASNQRFDLAGGVLSVDPAGLFHVNSARFRHVGGTLNGSVLVSDGTLDLLHDGVGSYIMRGGSNILNGNIGPTQSVLIRGEPGINSAVSTEDGLANYGTLTFNSVVVAANANLTALGAGAFINGPTGIININAGTGGARTYSWNLTNDGTINVNAAATFQRTSAVMTTSGTFNVSAGNSLLVNASNQRFDLAGGVLSVDPAGLFHVNSARFRHVGGTLNGSVLVSDGTLDLLHDGVGSYIMRGGSNILNGDIGSAQSVLIRGEPGINSAVSTEDGLANHGLLTFSSVAVVASANLTAQGAGAFINGPGGMVQLLSGSGGSRTFNVVLDNRGAFNANASQGVSLGRAGAAHVNSGDFIITQGTCTVTGSSFTNQLGGTVKGNGTLNVSAVGGLLSMGDVAPGLSIGALAVTGTYDQGATGRLVIEMMGTGAGQFDVLSVSGAATLAGTVQVDLAMGYVPAVGDVYRILNYAGRTGVFSGVAASNPGVLFDVIYNSNHALLVVTAIPAPNAAALAALAGLAAARRRHRG